MRDSGHTEGTRRRSVPFDSRAGLPERTFGKNRDTGVGAKLIRTFSDVFRRLHTEDLGLILFGVELRGNHPSDFPNV